MSGSHVAAVTCRRTGNRERANRPFSIAQIFPRASRHIPGCLRSPAARAGSELVGQAPDITAILAEHVGTNHRTHVAMPEQFLDRADVVPRLGERSERPTQSIINLDSTATGPQTAHRSNDSRRADPLRRMT